MGWFAKQGYRSTPISNLACGRLCFSRRLHESLVQYSPCSELPYPARRSPHVADIFLGEVGQSGCWHRFLTRVKEGDFYEGKVADSKETKRCTELESADGSPPMGQRNMLRRCWFVCSGARPMESCRWSQERRRGSWLYENLDDSVVIFKIVYL